MIYGLMHPTSWKRDSRKVVCSILPTESIEGGQAGVTCFRLSDGETTGVEKGEKVRFIVLEDVKGQTVSIFIEASTLGFAEFFSKAQQMIKTVEWKGT